MAFASAAAAKEYFDNISDDDEEEHTASPAKKAIPTQYMDQAYYQMIQRGSSSAQFDAQFRAQGFGSSGTSSARVENFPRDSKRIAVIFRLMRQLVS